MSDLIERSAVLHDLETLWDYSTVDGITASTVLKQVKTDVKNIPAVDAVPVVRCKNCTHYNAGYECLIDGYGVERDPEWFCGDGERKDGEQHD